MVKNICGYSWGNKNQQNICSALAASAQKIIFSHEKKQMVLSSASKTVLYVIGKIFYFVPTIRKIFLCSKARGCGRSFSSVVIYIELHDEDYAAIKYTHERRVSYRVAACFARDSTAIPSSFSLNCFTKSIEHTSASKKIKFHPKKLFARK